MPTYDVSDHELLSAEAEVIRGAILSPSTEFIALEDEAELLLDLDTTSFTGREERLAELAIVYQINHSVAYDPDAEVVQSQNQASAGKTFKTSLSPINSRAKAIADELLAVDTDTTEEGYEVLTSLQ